MDVSARNKEKQLLQSAGVDSYSAHQFSTCGQKITYSSEKNARDNAKHLKEKYGTKLVPYKCSVCGRWHLRTRKGSKRTQREELDVLNAKIESGDQVARVVSGNQFDGYLEHVNGMRYRGSARNPDGKFEIKDFQARCDSEAIEQYDEWQKQKEQAEAKRLMVKSKEPKAKQPKPKPIKVIEEKPMAINKPAPKPVEVKQDELYVITFRSKLIKWTDNKATATNVVEALNDTLNLSGVETADKYSIQAVNKWIA